jgi:uncharacterized protein YpuA (DUF1002 family)
MNENVTLSFLKKLGLLAGLMSMLLILVTPVQAGMVSTEDILLLQDRAQLARMLERDDVQQQLTELGVDPDSARARVNQMTEAEVAQLNGRLAELPAGGNIGTVEILLIIIIILLVI